VHRVTSTVAALVMLSLVALPASGLTGGGVDPAAVLDRVCAADVDGAAALIGEDAVASPVPAVAAGQPIVIVTDPLVPPGIPHALLRTGAGLCTVEAFNLTVAPGLDDPAALAATFAATAGMPWLGEVDVTDVRVGGDVVALTTVGGRHGASSDWTIAVDRRGIREASFTTTAIGLGDPGPGATPAGVHTLEGVTSLPGHDRRWSRDADGLLRIDASILDDLAADRADRDAAAANAARVAGLAPGELLEDELDGQVVRMTLGIAAPGVQTAYTGVDLADRLLYVHDGMGRIYDQYESWGATDVWDAPTRTIFGISTIVPDPIGYINFNSGISEYCLACAFTGEAIEIHVNLAFAELTEGPLLGVSYPDDNSYTLEVVGHEFTHAVQGGYGDGRAPLLNSFFEGTATASQALFHEAENSAQPGSIEYLDTPNGCEGFENDFPGWIEAQAEGPFDFQSYAACYFWWAYLARHGGPGLVRIMEALPGIRSDAPESAVAPHLRQLDLASPDGDGAEDLAFWAAAYTAGTAADGYRITDGSGDVHDWFALLRPAERARDLAPGTAHDVTLVDGGTAGFRVTAAGTLDALPEGARAFVYDIADGHLHLVSPADQGTPLAAGQILAVVRHGTTPASGTVSMRAATG
jgi:hypothetical protein